MFGTAYRVFCRAFLSTILVGRRRQFYALGGTQRLDEIEQVFFF